MTAPNAKRHPPITTPPEPAWASTLPPHHYPCEEWRHLLTIPAILPFDSVRQDFSGATPPDHGKPWVGGKGHFLPQIRSNAMRHLAHRDRGWIRGWWDHEKPRHPLQPPSREAVTHAVLRECFRYGFKGPLERVKKRWDCYGYLRTGPSRIGLGVLREHLLSYGARVSGSECHVPSSPTAAW